MAANPLHAIWSSVAPAWSEHADFVDERGAEVGAAMLAAADLQPGDEVLELGCGPGGVGITAADVVGADGRVVLSDVSAEMVAIAEARAKQRAAGNVTVCCLDMENIAAPDSSFDKVFSREVLMLVGDPVRAVREALRVLRPGGRAVFAVWGPPADNPWLSALLDAVSAQLGAPVPPPGMPGPFALSGEGALAGILRQAGLSDVLVEEVDDPFHAESFDEWWTIVPSLAGPVAALLNSLPDDQTTAIRAAARQALSRYSDGIRYTIPGSTLVAVGRRPTE
ncbi:methylase involved in ubiquinone/menaquinone biosynthesis [Mycolicibacterium chubuense NBB4]|uniref:Methylase involved in ubiquinone/menaquinone biosynthesis n=1 Tax=Mycolicibacterium chubuense (strain NBB4) TaxID=710421 RepID=I4BRN6_MYCCN|nr:methyltransferase domain-containing protein [Mycolicibacterium chubuense]AFM19943.1 methylase involved in ubiquinone/menaquinone biosynthesis [Mycolicibacterium chubuense NBB4]